MATLADIVGTFGLTVSEKKTEIKNLPISHAPTTLIAFTTTVRQYRQTTFYLHRGHVYGNPEPVSRNQSPDPCGLGEL